MRKTSTKQSTIAKEKYLISKTTELIFLSWLFPSHYQEILMMMKMDTRLYNLTLYLQNDLRKPKMLNLRLEIEFPL
jgi:hypothetical protein